MLLTTAYGADSEKVIATSGNWSIIEKIEDDSGILLLVKTQEGESKIYGASEDIYPIIQENTPPAEAEELALQLVKKEIESAGGADKAQANINKQAEQFGPNFFNYLNPLAIRAYNSLGVIIPN